jgi:pre-mRNA cleavage complex 2 protein Pcf11
MTSLSPRASFSGATPGAVVEDFADSLSDLTQNNKYMISNLTIIAKESTEHAQAISKKLEDHIKKVWTNSHVAMHFPKYRY